MSRVRGKKRLEIIKKFLEGEEDPDYEVIPTVTKGKYFVRPRKEKLDVEDDEEENVEDNSDIEESSTPVQLSKETKSKKQNPKQKKQLKQVMQKQNPKQKKYQQNSSDIYDPTIPYQILEQLKILGEEQKLKREKKEQKKLMKHQIQKQLSKKQKVIESSSEEEYDYEVVEEPTPHITNFLRPIPVRRKVNLLK